MMKMNKKAIMPEALIRIIIAVVFAVTFIFIGCKIFSSTSNEAQQSYTAFIEEIKNLKDGEMKSMILVMDDETGVFGFSKSTQKIPVSKVYLNPNTEKWNDRAFYLTRPPVCNTGTMCICLCTGISLDNNNIKCNKIFCENIEAMDIPKGPSVTINNEEIPDDFFVNVRSKTISKQFSDLSGNNPSYISDDRRHTVYNERYRNYIKSCTSSDCIVGLTKTETLNKAE
jgi:hypothetical protein